MTKAWWLTPSHATSYGARFATFHSYKEGMDLRAIYQIAFFLTAFLMTAPKATAASTAMQPAMQPVSEPNCAEDLTLFQQHGVIFRSEAMLKVAHAIHEWAKRNVNMLLIYGETGAGKENAALMFHKLSHTKERPFIKVIGGTYTDDLFKSDIFGYKKGAFTGAIADKKGSIAEAEGGTVFFDEFQNFTPKQQEAILEFFQSKQYWPVGDTRAHRANVKIVIGMNKSPEELVEQGKLREDLYYRITNEGRIDLPPLRQRKEDIPLLAQFFLQQANERYYTNYQTIDPQLLKTIEANDWRGNIRELQGVINRLVLRYLIVDPNGTVLKRRLDDPPALTGLPAGNDSANKPKTDEEWAQQIANALVEANYVKTAAAARLGIPRDLFYYRLERYQKLGMLSQGKRATYVPPNKRQTFFSAEDNDQLGYSAWAGRVQQARRIAEAFEKSHGVRSSPSGAAFFLHIPLETLRDQVRQLQDAGLLDKNNKYIGPSDNIELQNASPANSSTASARQ